MARPIYDKESFEKARDSSEFAYGVMHYDLPGEIFGYRDGMITIKLKSGATITVTVGESGFSIRKGPITFDEIEEDIYERIYYISLDEDRSLEGAEGDVMEATQLVTDEDAINELDPDEVRAVLDFINKHYPGDYFPFLNEFVYKYRKAW